MHHRCAFVGGGEGEGAGGGQGPSGVWKEQAHYRTPARKGLQIAWGGQARRGVGGGGGGHWALHTGHISEEKPPNTFSVSL